MTAKKRPSAKTRISPSKPPLVVAVASAVGGLLYGLAFEPFDHSWLVWLSLTPLLWGVWRSRNLRSASLCGAVWGTVAGLMVIRPLVTASTWTGWATVTTSELESIYTRQSWFLNALWVVIALWAGGIFCAAFAGLLSHLAGRTPWKFLLLAPTLWMVVMEWLRSLTTWNFQWGFMATAVADFAWPRQLAALGGVWLLSGFAVLVNAALLMVWVRHERKRPWAAPTAVALLCIAILLGGALRVRTFDPARDAVAADALQHQRGEYSSEKFTPFGLDAAYLELTYQIAGRRDTGDVDLLVLPESVAYGALSLDGSISPDKPPEAQSTLSEWTEALTFAISGTDTVVVLGVETVEDGRSHNSMVFWTSKGPAGWYHKRKLVPFGEYQPALLEWIGAKGRSQFSPGHGAQIVSVNGMRLGTFICQEVLVPSVLRDSVRSGASLLVSGGNDGVFASPAVAATHADMTRIRAVESGRYIVRAMKTGVSAIVAPTGEELTRSVGDEPTLLRGQVEELEGRTPYVVLGSWPVWLGLCLILGMAAQPRLARRLVARREAATRAVGDR